MPLFCFSPIVVSSSSLIARLVAAPRIGVASDRGSFFSVRRAAPLVSLVALLFMSGCLRARQEERADNPVAGLVAEVEALADLPAACRPWFGLEDAAVLDRVRRSAEHATALGYSHARDYMFGRTEPWLGIDDGMVECIYTGRRAAIDGTRTPDGMNTEHTWPRSLGAKEEPMLSDLHHLFVTDHTANGRRSNYPFGDAECGEGFPRDCNWEGGGSKLGLSANSQLVFEVRPEGRGDIARGQFYFAARYGMGIAPDTEAALRRWSAQDPPDDRERARNDVIESIQGNRNPFIDCPDLVDHVADF